MESPFGTQGTHGESQGACKAKGAMGILQDALWRIGGMVDAATVITRCGFGGSRVVAELQAPRCFAMRRRCILFPCKDIRRFCEFLKTRTPCGFGGCAAAAACSALLAPLHIIYAGVCVCSLNP